MAYCSRFSSASYQHNRTAAGDVAASQAHPERVDPKNHSVRKPRHRGNEHTTHGRGLGELEFGEDVQRHPTKPKIEDPTGE